MVHRFRDSQSWISGRRGIDGPFGFGDPPIKFGAYTGLER